jgi:mycothiol maleylpyruvate isomerase-like protein
LLEHHLRVSLADSDHPPTIDASGGVGLRRTISSEIAEDAVMCTSLAHACDTPGMIGKEACRASYSEVLRLLPTLDEDTGWRPTGCAGWTVRDLLLHLLSDAQRAIVALHTPGEGPPDVDAVTYWSSWKPGTPGADAGRRGTRIMASAWSSVSPIAELYGETARAVLVAADERAGDDLVRTQGKTLTVDSLLSTLAVEATVHQLDLGLGEPTALGLAEVRRVLDGLLGEQAPIADDARYALVGTGRASPTEEEQATLGALTDRFPLFG